jgi:hypothetical protein
MVNKTQIKYVIASILFKYSASLCVLIALCALILSIGFFTGTPNNNNYYALLQLMNLNYWGLLFLIYSLVKFYRIFLCTKHTWVDIYISAIGIWAWNYIFLSFTLFDSVEVAPVELLLSVPVIIEAWILTTMVYTKNDSNARRA